MSKKPSVCVSGMVAAGKTTLARYLAANNGYTLVSESSLGTDYLDRLFRDPSRWGLEAQIAFLLEKAAAVHNQTTAGNYVLDRSLEEDATIFFEYFREEHSIDELSVRTYESLFSLLQQVLPNPDVWVLCDIDYETVNMRINNRERFNNYVEGYAESIYSRYQVFFMKKRNSANTYIVNSSYHDWTDEACAADIAKDVRNIVEAFPFGTPALDILERHV